MRPRPEDPGLLFLHARPLDGSMWAARVDLLPGAAWAATLYGLGDTIGAWALRALQLASSERLLVVGCSVGGPCALEGAALAPERIAALVLIGTKAAHRPEPALCRSAGPAGARGGRGRLADLLGAAVLFGDRLHADRGRQADRAASAAWGRGLIGSDRAVT